MIVGSKHDLFTKLMNVDGRGTQFMFCFFTSKMLITLS